MYKLINTKTGEVISESEEPIPKEEIEFAAKSLNVVVQVVEPEE